MNLNRLEYFLVLAETGSLHKASEMLHVSPPAISKAMKVLEQELDISLWVRDGRRNILSDAGKLLLKRAPILVNELRDLRAGLTQKNTGPQPIRIATFEVFSTYFLRFMDELEWNNHSLELHELLPGEVEKYICQGEVDIGITYMPVPDANLDFLKVTSIEMGVFARKGAFKNIPQKELPFVTPISPLQGVPTKVRGLDGWPEDAYQRHVLHKVTLLESALELCRQGRVAGYFPAFIIEEHNRQVVDKYKLERRTSPYHGRICTADVFIVKRKSYEETAIIKQLAMALRKITKT
jgi:DNA-binding transcriptional LysR family regulator